MNYPTIPISDQERSRCGKDIVPIHLRKYRKQRGCMMKGFKTFNLNVEK